MLNPIKGNCVQRKHTRLLIFLTYIACVHLPMLCVFLRGKPLTCNAILQKEPGTSLGISEDVVAMSVLAKMQPEERATLGIKPFRVVVNTCQRAQELAAQYDEKRAAVAAKVASAAAAKA